MVHDEHKQILYVLILDLGKRGRLFILSWRGGGGLGELGLRGHGQGHDEHHGIGTGGMGLWRLGTWQSESPRGSWAWPTLQRERWVASAMEVIGAAVGVATGWQMWQQGTWERQGGGHKCDCERG